jgi:hypothetical protein
LENNSSSRGLCLGWLLLAALLLGIGSLAVYSALNENHISDTQYNKLVADGNQPIDKVADSDFYFTLYAGWGFMVAGFVSVSIGVLAVFLSKGFRLRK